MQLNPTLILFVQTKGGMHLDPPKALETKEWKFLLPILVPQKNPTMSENGNHDQLMMTFLVDSTYVSFKKLKPS